MLLGYLPTRVVPDQRPLNDDDDDDDDGDDDDDF